MQARILCRRGARSAAALALACGLGAGGTAYGGDALLDTLPDDKLITLGASAEESEHTVTIFTDVLCPHCRALHRDLDFFLEDGLRVRYAALPVIDGSREIMADVWCSDSPEAALEAAMAGDEEAVTAEEGCEAPLDAHQQVAEQSGANAVPAMVDEDGEVAFGHETILDRIEEAL